MKKKIRLNNYNYYFKISIIIKCKNVYKIKPIASQFRFEPVVFVAVVVNLHRW